MELGLAYLDDSVDGDRGAADPVPANRSLLVSWPRWVNFRCRIPGLLRGDQAGRPLVGRSVLWIRSNSSTWTCSSSSDAAKGCLSS